ncbi:hypothetical protein PIB30_055078 [Stylosanthes scabra]|uniref:Uncharacterized protein n=1 Tax=Stylosanthes scabra TaxID=79078 RepID=A0ABU6QJZ4_9FABA|nr:hypothetical protein [Stylosanthes scabra]
MVTFVRPPTSAAIRCSALPGGGITRTAHKHRRITTNRTEHTDVRLHSNSNSIVSLIGLIFFQHSKVVPTSNISWSMIANNPVVVSEKGIDD